MLSSACCFHVPSFDLVERSLTFLSSYDFFSGQFRFGYFESLCHRRHQFYFRRVGKPTRTATHDVLSLVIRTNSSFPDVGKVLFPFLIVGHRVINFSLKFDRYWDLQINKYRNEIHLRYCSCIKTQTIFSRYTFLYFAIFLFLIKFLD